MQVLAMDGLPTGTGRAVDVAAAEGGALVLFPTGLLSGLGRGC